jgi:hypothetical protein
MNSFYYMCDYNKMETYLGTLPIDLRRQQILYLPYADILELCDLPEYEQLCQDQYFWAQKAQIEFNVSPSKFGQTELKPYLRYLELLSTRGGKCTYGSELVTTPNQCLISASRQGDLNLVKYFFTEGATDLPNAISEGARMGHLEVVDFLLQQVPYNDQDLFDWKRSLQYILYAGIKTHNQDVIDYAFTQGATLDIPAFYIAGLNGHQDLINQLLNHPQFFEVPHRIQVNMFRRAVLGASERGDRDLLAYLQSIVPQANLTDVILNGASAGGHLDLAQEAIRNGASGIPSALNEASGNGQRHIVQYLLPLVLQRANSNKYLELALFNAIEGKYIDIVNDLMEARIPPERALLIASKNKPSRFILRLIKHLIDKYKIDPHSEVITQAIRFARMKSNYPVVEYLQSLQAQP